MCGRGRGDLVRVVVEVALDQAGASNEENFADDEGRTSLRGTICLSHFASVRQEFLRAGAQTLRYTVYKLPSDGKVRNTKSGSRALASPFTPFPRPQGLDSRQHLVHLPLLSHQRCFPRSIRVTGDCSAKRLDSPASGGGLCVGS